MEFYTRVALPKMPFQFSHDDKILLLGSCFAEHIGAEMQKEKFAVDVNPFGILYNPASVAAAIRRLIHGRPFDENDLFLYEGLYHSYSHHSKFSHASKEACLAEINKRLLAAAKQLPGLTRLVVTLGTAWVYRLGNGGEVVGNCHKLPEKMFERSRLSVDEVVAEWSGLLTDLGQQAPNLKVLFTVSPIRHWKDGAHGNQLSKATLLLAVDRLLAMFPAQVAYFPAYEIVMDELRDYRYYAEDMLHPSATAVAYVWERFAEGAFSAETKALLHEWEEIKRAIGHKPFHPEGEEHKRFIRQTLLKIEQLRDKFPSFDLSNEQLALESNL